MEVTFWGVRGSIPAPGPETNRYGGNTSCVELRTATGGLVIIDMGTGLMHLGNTLMAGAFGKGAGRATVLLARALGSHPGLPVLRAGVHPRQPVHRLRAGAARRCSRASSRAR